MLQSTIAINLEAMCKPPLYTVRTYKGWPKKPRVSDSDVSMSYRYVNIFKYRTQYDILFYISIYFRYFAPVISYLSHVASTRDVYTSTRCVTCVEGIAYAVGRAIEENSIYRNVNIYE